MSLYVGLDQQVREWDGPAVLPPNPRAYLWGAIRRRNTPCHASLTPQSSPLVSIPARTSAGDRKILGRITKRGNRYLRMLFMQAARVVLLRPRKLDERLRHNVLATALANKLARIAWSVRTTSRIRGASRRSSRYDMNSLWFTKGMTATLLRHRRSPIGASERRWLRRDGFSQS
jgi:Transposase IS116/IS110/IS902 family